MPPSKPTTTYEEIMGMTGKNGTTPEKALGQRLVTFRKWLSTEARAKVHPAMCIVNGEATDGTRNAPVLVLDRSNEALVAGGVTNGATTAAGEGGATHPLEGRVGVVDLDGAATALYDRTMGCQVRSTREIRKDEVLLSLPRSAMITPDLVAASDAGKAVLACCRAPPNSKNYSYWDVLENTTICAQKVSQKIVRSVGPQMLVKILQERKKAETAWQKRNQQQRSSAAGNGWDDGTQSQMFQLADSKTISTRAPFLAFLIQQRFSNAEKAPVESDSFCDTDESVESNAWRSCTAPILCPPDAPESFSPYARTLPSSVSLPICWKRNELALLSGCIPGVALLQEVASSTMQLVAEFAALLDAGILERFPDTFPPGLLTWDRWVWAAAVFSSRTLPATAYINIGDESIDAFQPTDPLEFQSPAEIWKELGVLIPLLDMLNHEAKDNQVTWEACVPEIEGESSNEGSPEPHPPRAVTHLKVKKGNEIFTNYGHVSNSHLLLSYGFAQMNNSADEVKMGWALMDAVGNVQPPYDFTPPFPLCADNVYESRDELASSSWWTDSRLAFLEAQINASAVNSLLSSLKAGTKMSATAYSDGTYDPILLAAIVCATIPAKEIGKYLEQDQTVVITKRHQTTIQRYIQFFFTRKLEKLLLNLENGLKAHFGNVNLWTKATEGGLKYQPDEGSCAIGWQTFFDAHAYKASMEVENRYYAMGTDSCILALYDGQLRALQVSVDGAVDDEKFEAGVLLQLENLGFVISDEECDSPMEGNEVAIPGSPSQNGSASKSPRNRKKNKGKKIAVDRVAAPLTATTGEKPPAVKLHIGNLSYNTTPSDLYDYFSEIYGQANVLECHIPIERDTGRSRGFGFVAMPESVAENALTSGRKHEVDGRILKVARSNSAGTTSTAKPVAGPVPVASDRCLKCGYRPKYCTCSRPHIPGFDPPTPGALSSLVPPPIPRGPLPLPIDHGRGPRDFGPPQVDRYRDDRRREYYENNRYHDRERRRYDDEHHRRGYDDDDDNYRERGRRDRERGRSYDRDRERDRDRSRSLSSSRRRDSSSRRERKSEPDDYDHARKHSRSRSRDKSSRKKRKRRNRSRSRSRSPNPPV